MLGWRVPYFKQTAPDPKHQWIWSVALVLIKGVCGLASFLLKVFGVWLSLSWWVFEVWLAFLWRVFGVWLACLWRVFGVWPAFLRALGSLGVWGLGFAFSI